MRKTWLAAMSIACAGLCAAGQADTQSIPRPVGFSAVDVGDLATVLFMQIRPCWNPPANPTGRIPFVVRVRMRLNIDGSLSGPPNLETTIYAYDQFGHATAMQAIAAIQACAPYKMPADRYALWRDVIVTFDPR